MKTIVTTLFCFLATSSVFSQIDTIANNIFENNGKLGIGINTPLSPLEVNGMIHSTNQGFKFPDGTIQTSAAINFIPELWNNISNNIFYNDGSVGIGRKNFESYFKTKLWVHEGWLQVSDSGYNDAGIIVNHLSKTGYGFARSLHQVYEGTEGDPYTEFRIRNNNDLETVTSWSIGADNSDEDKLIISNRINNPTGASPSFGNRLITLKTTGELGIGTDNPFSPLEVNGLIHSSSNGFKFPDGTIQTTAANSANSYWKSINSNEIFTTNKVGIDRTDFQSYFLYTKFWVHNGWLQVSDSTDHDAGLVITHLKKSGYGFARSLHQVYSGVDGDPYTEFRVRNNDDMFTDQSWAIGIDNSDDNKLKITSRTNYPTGASPSYGNDKLTITPEGNIGITTNEPKARLEIANGDIFISDIKSGIIMKSPDGNCWRGILDNSGNLIFNKVDSMNIIVYPTDFKNNAQINNISFFPNPVENTLTIASLKGNFKNSNAVIYTLDGRIVRKDQLFSDYSTINLSAIPSGSYIIKVINKKGEELASEILIKD